MNEIIVTTADLKQEYEIIAPVYFQVSNRGFFTSRLSKLLKKYEAELKELKEDKQYNDKNKINSRLEKSFFIAVKELQRKAREIGADAVVGMRQSVELDQTGHPYFSLQMYGTAVKLKK